MGATEHPGVTVGDIGIMDRVGQRIRAAEEEAPGLPFTLEILPSSVHGFFDYTVGLGAILTPYLFGFSRVAPARLAMQLQGVMAILYSLFTDYEWGIRKVIPFRTHLLLDFLGAVMLIASPRILGFPRIGSRHVALGLLELSVTLMSRRQPWTG